MARVDAAPRAHHETQKEINDVHYASGCDLPLPVCIIPAGSSEPVGRTIQ